MFRFPDTTVLNPTNMNVGRNMACTDGKTLLYGKKEIYIVVTTTITVRTLRY